MKRYVYDIEIFPNFFGVTFFPVDYYIPYYEAYIAIDKAQLEYKVNTLGQIGTPNNDEKLLKFIDDKRKLLDAIGAKQFSIFKGYAGEGDKSYNELPLMVDFFKNHNVITGYNNNNYDNNMLDIVLYHSKYCDSTGYHSKHKCHITDVMYDKSRECIDYGNGYSRLLDFKKYYKRPYTGYDIQKILYLDKSFTSLKQVAICLKWHRIQDLPYEYDVPIHYDNIVHINDYNVNDDLITLKLCENQKAELDLRDKLSVKFIINFRNMSRSSIGKAIAIEFYSKFSGLDKKQFIDTKTDRWKIRCRDIVDRSIVFKTDPLRNLLKKICNATIVVGSKSDDDKFKFEFEFGGTMYTMAKGGLHSKDDATIYNNIDGRDVGYILIDADVDSYYPNGILKFRVCPSHLIEPAFRATIGYTKDTRITAKHANRRTLKILKERENELTKQQEAELRHIADDHLTEADGLKIAINRMYGALGDPKDFFYDAKCTYQTTVNLQLSLLMLIEDLFINGIQIISANTDGIVCRLKPEQKDTYDEVCKHWMEYTTFNLEFTEYERYFRNDVNNYIAIKKGFKSHYDSLEDKSDIAEVNKIEKDYIKRKGLFIQDVEFNKGYNSPVVAQALNKYLIYDIPYIETIRNHIHTSKDAIYDYCISQKTDKKFNIFWRLVENGEIKQYQLQKSNRFYVCTKDIGGEVYKKSKEPVSRKVKGVEKMVYAQTRLISGWNLFLFNDYVFKDDYCVDFAYYNRECSKVLFGKNKKAKGVVSDNNMGNLFTDEMFEAADLFKEQNTYQNGDGFDITEYYGDDDEPIDSEIVYNTSIWDKYGFDSEEAYLEWLRESSEDIPF